MAPTSVPWATSSTAGATALWDNKVCSAYPLTLKRNTIMFRLDLIRCGMYVLPPDRRVYKHSDTTRGMVQTCTAS